MERSSLDSFTLNRVEFGKVCEILSRFCRCSLGHSLARRIAPSPSPDTVHAWLHQTSQMVEAVRDVGVLPLGGVTDIRKALSRATPGGGADGEDFSAIASTLEGAANVRNWLFALPERLEAIQALAEKIGNFEGEIKAVRSVLEPHGRVRDEASQRLAGIRREIDATTQHIHDVIHGYLRQPEVAKLLQNQTVTMHGDRYVLPVRVENRGRLPGVVHRESNTGATVFVEPNASVELNNRLADLHGDERNEVQRLLNQLAMRISGRSEEILSTLRELAHVDVLSAKAQYAYQFDMICPQVTEKGELSFVQASHPLLIHQVWQQEKAGVAEADRHPVVPIDVRLGSDFDLLVITGSNTGGKTVTLKTIALLALMAQSGMHVPAKRATLPVFRDVFIDIGDEQSLQQSLSTFGAHIKRMRYVLRKADRASLVLFDELGAGTDPDEGGAIGQAVLDELRHTGCLGVITTHLSVLKAYALCHERVDNASVEFDTETLSPTYHVRIGTPGESHAITVAQKLGMTKRLIDAARRHLAGQGKQFRKAIRATGEARQVAEEARAEAVAAQMAAETQQEVYESKLADLHRLQDEFQTWLATVQDWKPGDEVYVESMGKVCRLVRLELHKQQAVVDAGNLEVEVPLRQLMPDLGQAGVRTQIADLRKQILDQAGETEKVRAEALHVQQEYQRSLDLQRQRAKQFDMWLGAIARLKVGDEVPIARKPGKAKVVKTDLAGLRVTVETGEGELELSLQDLFPQTGPFAPRPARPERKGRGGRPHPKHGQGRAHTETGPMHRRKPDAKAAQKNLAALLATKPGEKVYVVPFGKRATLIRINEQHQQAVVQSGIFELQVPLADLEPVRKNG